MDRLRLWDLHRDVAMLALAHFLDDDAGPEPIVVVADTSDESTQTFTGILQGAIDDCGADSVVVESDENLWIFVVPVSVVRDVTSIANPECALALMEEPPDDLMWAAIVSRGGMTLLCVPIEPLRVLGSA